MNGIDTVSGEEIRMTGLGERLDHADQQAAEQCLSGPVIGCIEEGAPGLATARVAGSLACWLGADLLLATVQQAHPCTSSGEDVMPAAVRDMRLLLDRAARELGQSAAIRVAIGEPAEKLLALAHTEDAELLVVPATGQSRVRTLLLGSVYLALAGAAPCPVVVVAPGVDALATTGPIVCGIDGSAPSIVAAGVAADLAERLETRLLLVHAANALPAAPPGVLGGHDRRHGEGLRMLQGVADCLPVTVPKLLLVELGPAAQRLAHVARTESAQMLVTGSRGRGRIASALLGSVASELATSVDRPLMIVPPDARRWRRGEPPAIATRWLRSGGAVLSMASNLDSASASHLEHAGARLLAATGGRLVIDLSDSSAIDDEAIRGVERLANRASELDGQLILVTTDSAVRRRLAQLGPHSVVVTEALDTALEAMAARSSVRHAQRNRATGGDRAVRSAPGRGSGPS
jgi:nucleotide-binding universal stress UspA family protein/anti-anti-sigma regulatory factor